MVPLIEFLSLTVLALIIGVISSMVGVGGGSLVVPLLDSVYSLPHELSVGTSSAMTMATAVSASFAYARQKRIDYGIGGAMMLGTVPTAYLGAQTLGIMKAIFGANSSNVGRGLFGVFLMIAALRMLLAPDKSTTAANIKKWAWERRIEDAHNHVFSYRADMVKGL
ncbi:MAG: sulfite exporter TauE/SafE family protein, partial [archaeon]